MKTFPTPHLDKLRATLANPKLPDSDKESLDSAIQRYSLWIGKMVHLGSGDHRFSSTEDGDEFIASMSKVLQEYKLYMDLDVIFDSTSDFLYRQKGQLKLDNSIIEEFIPYLVYPFIPAAISESVLLGPRGCFSSMSFTASLGQQTDGGGMQVRTKDQDFALSREIFLKASFEESFRRSTQQKSYLAYVAAELKTNLDKTMFQEACATAHDVKTAVAGAKYFLVCEWLDMTPLSTAATDIDEVLLLRGKRLGSQVRKHFSTAAERHQKRDVYSGYLSGSPFRADVLSRLVQHILGVLDNEHPAEEDALKRGYF